MGKLLGDIVGDFAKALGFKECAGCKRRREKLNNAHRRVRGGKKPACAECDKAAGR
jgi:hypothetical protein